MDNACENSYLIYNRKSTDDADNQKNSLSYQKTRNSDYAQRENLSIASLTISGFCQNGVIDERHSAFKERDEFILAQDGSVQYRILRPKFRQLVKMLSERTVKGVIFLCWDRASRNDQDNLIIKKLIDLGSDIRFADATYDKSSAGRLHMHMDGMFSNYSSYTTSEKVKNAYAKLRAEGRCVYNAPIGYLDNGSKEKPFDASGNWSHAQLGKWACEQGLTKKSVRRKRSKDEILNNLDISTIEKVSRPADHKTIEYILSNPFYIGKIKVPKGYANSTAHQPLIDTSLFYKVQNILKRRKVSIYYMDKRFYTYRGFVRCECGRAYSPYEQKGIIYYRSRCKSGCTNGEPNLNEEDITKAIQSLLNKMYFTDEELSEIESRAKKELKYLSEQRDKTLNDLQSRQRAVMADIDYIAQNKITLLRTKSMDIDAINAEINRLETKLATVNQEIDTYTATAPEMLRHVVTFSNLVKNAGMYFEHALDNERREIATIIFTELTFSGKKLINYRANDGFDVLLGRSWITGSPCSTIFELLTGRRSTNILPWF